MEQYKPPGLIKKIYFKNLSFGDAPFKIENVWVEDEGEKHVLMEVHNWLCSLGFTVDAKCLATLHLWAVNSIVRLNLSMLKEMIPSLDANDMHAELHGIVSDRRHCWYMHPWCCITMLAPCWCSLTMTVMLY